MAAFELNVRAFSKWIGAFTLDEWVAYGYTQDLQYYYCSGYVNFYHEYRNRKETELMV